MTSSPTAKYPLWCWRMRRSPRTTSSSCPRLSNSAGWSAMCELCSDEEFYQAFMDNLDDMERQGKTPDPDEEHDIALQASQAAKRANRSPFICDPIETND